MKIFIDSAKLDEIKEAYSIGIIDGVTTNPSLIKKAVDALKAQKKKVNMESYIKQILTTARGTPVSLEVTELKYDGMVKQGKALFKKFNPTAKNVYIKIPVNPSFDETPSIDGIKAIKALSKARIPVNCTLIFTPEQALLAAKAGAKFVSPFAGKQQEKIKELHEEVGDAVVSVSFDTDPNEEESQVIGHANKHGFDWRFVVSPPSVTKALIDEFSISVVNAPGAPVVLICEDQSARFLGRGVKSANELKQEIEAGC